MSVVQLYLEARALLGVSPEASLSDVKMAYRRRVLEHPPDVDPEGFQRIREAFELLNDTGDRAREILLRPVPAIAPPALPDPDGDSVAQGATAIALLRVIAARIDLNVLLGNTDVKTAGPPGALGAKPSLSGRTPHRSGQAELPLHQGERRS